MARQYDHQSEDGKHLFSEDGADVSSGEVAGEQGEQPSPEANLYAIKDAAYSKPLEYEPLGAKSGWSILLFGLGGVGLFLLTGLMGLRFYFAPMLLLSLILSVPAWLFGREYLLTIRAGARKAGGEGKASIGKVLGILVTFSSIAISIGWLIWFFFG